MLQYWISGLRAGIRGRSFFAVFLLGVFLIFVAFLSGSFSPRHPRTVALDIGLSGIRITLVLLNLLWMQELFMREIDRKSVLFSLTYPITRDVFVFGRYLAILTMSALAIIVFGLSLLIAVQLAGGYYQQDFPVSLGIPLIATLVALLIDVSVVSAFSVWIAAVATSPAVAISTGAAFAVSGKALGATMEYIASGADGDTRMVSTFGPLIDAIHWLLPDLSRLDWRDWPLYGTPPTLEYMMMSLMMAIGYIVVMMVLAAHYFRRREFS